MRNLTVKQKKYLDKLPIERTTVDDLTVDEWETIEKMHDTEILHQNVNRYLLDRAVNRIYKHGEI